MRLISWLRIGTLFALVGSAPAAAQPVAPVIPVMLQMNSDALAQDAAAVAERLGVSADEAARQLQLQEASVAATQAIADRYAGRLAGVAIEYRPDLRIVLLLTGDEPVPDATIDAAGTPSASPSTSARA